MNRLSGMLHEMPVRLAVSVYLPVLVLLALAGILSSTTGIHAGDLLRDVTTTASLPWYTGGLTYVGVLLWCASAAITTFGGSIMLRSSAGSTGPERHDAVFLLASGALSALLLVDDLFLLHEEVLPSLLPANEQVFTGINALVLLGYLTVFRAYLIRPAGVLLLLAVGFLALSTIVDASQDLSVIEKTNSSSTYLVEEGLKLLGIATWFVALTQASWMDVERLVHTPLSQHDVVEDEKLGGSVVSAER